MRKYGRNRSKASLWREIVELRAQVISEERSHRAMIRRDAEIGRLNLYIRALECLPDERRATNLDLLHRNNSLSVENAQMQAALEVFKQHRVRIAGNRRKITMAKAMGMMEAQADG